jgi:hypothetical protein
MRRGSSISATWFSKWIQQLAANGKSCGGMRHVKVTRAQCQEAPGEPAADPNRFEWNFKPHVKYLRQIHEVGISILRSAPIFSGANNSVLSFFRVFPKIAAAVPTLEPQAATAFRSRQTFVFGHRHVSRSV